MLSRYVENSKEVGIASEEYWFKVVDMLQSNWALIDTTDSNATIWFMSESSQVFDSLTYGSKTQAENALRKNGFDLFARGTHVHRFLSAPRRPFFYFPHPSGPIYSSGRFWS